jgi:hypothetical protein
LLPPSPRHSLREAAPAASTRSTRTRVRKENNMRDVIFILLTLAIFAVMALIVKGAERL